MKIGDKYLYVSTERRFPYIDSEGGVCNIILGDIITVTNIIVDNEHGRLGASEILVNNLKVDRLEGYWSFFAASRIGSSFVPLTEDSVNTLLEDLNNQAIDIHKQMNKLKINYELHSKD